MDIDLLDDFNMLLCEQFASPHIGLFASDELHAAALGRKQVPREHRVAIVEQVARFFQRSLRESLEIKDGSLWTAERKRSERDRLLEETPQLRAELARRVDQATLVERDAEGKIWLKFTEWWCLDMTTDVH